MSTKVNICNFYLLKKEFIFLVFLSFISCQTEDDKVDMRSGFFYKKSEKDKAILNKPISIISSPSIRSDNVMATHNVTNLNRTMDGEKISNKSNVIKPAIFSDKKEIIRESVSKNDYDALFISLASFMDMVFVYSSHSQEYFNNSNVEILSLKESKITKKSIIDRLRFYIDISKKLDNREAVVKFYGEGESLFKGVLENCKTIHDDLMQIHKVIIQVLMQLNNEEFKKLLQDFGRELFLVRYANLDREYKKFLLSIEIFEKKSESSSIVSKGELEDNMDLSIFDNQNLVKKESIFTNKEVENFSKVERPFSPKMPEYNRRNRVYDYFSSKDKKREQSLKKEKSFEELKQRANSIEVSKRVKKATELHRKTYELKDQLVNLCKGKKGSVETLQLVLLDGKFPEIERIESNNEVIKIYLSNNAIISTDKEHKHSALITFESRLAEEIMKIRIEAHNGN